MNVIKNVFTHFLDLPNQQQGQRAINVLSVARNETPICDYYNCGS